MVGMGRHISVGDARSHPYGPLAPVLYGSGPALCHEVHTFPDELHDPDFIGVADGKRLSGTAVAMQFHEFGDDAYGLSGGARTLQSQEHQAAVVGYARGVFELRPSAEGSLADGDLMLIHKANRLIGMGHLGYAAPRLCGAAVVEGHSAPGRPVRSRPKVQLAVADMRVRRIAHHGGAVGRGAAGDEKVRTGPYPRPGGHP